MRVTLEEDGDRTKWTLVSKFGTREAREATARSRFAEIIEQGSEKLENLARSL